MFLILPVILGAIASAALSGIFSVAGTIAQNKYNSPASQLRRIRKAGLPMAYMYGGKVSQQSEVPKMSIDPTLGVSQAVQLKQQKTVQDAQVSNLAAETAGKDIANELAAGERDYLLNSGEVIDGVAVNNQVLGLEYKQAKLKADKFIAEHEEELKEIAERIANYNELTDKLIRSQELERIKQQIKNMVKQSELMGQLYDIRKIDQVLNETIGGALDSAPKWMQAIYWTLMKLFSKI